MSRTQVTQPATTSVVLNAAPATLPQHSWVVITRSGAPQVFSGDQVDHWTHLQVIPNVREIWHIENTPINRAAQRVLMHIAGQVVDGGATRVYRA